MIAVTIGVPKEVKQNEGRVALTPSGAIELIKQGHKVLVESQAGINAGFTDHDYYQAGAAITFNVADVWNMSNIVVKVKEPQKQEFKYFRKNLILFTYLHLASPECAELKQALEKAGVLSFAYESVEDKDGSFPLLKPMSAVAGRMAIQIAANLLEQNQTSNTPRRGILMGGIPGVEKTNVTILGGGIVGQNAAQVALGMGANVTIVDISQNVLSNMSMMFGNQINTLFSNEYNIQKSVLNADVVIGAVLIPNKTPPKLVTTRMVTGMKDGSVIIDVAVDQGGCIETCRPTTHQNPIYLVKNVIHYCVPNMPGAVPRTSTIALTNVTLKYISILAQITKTQLDMDESNFGGIGQGSLFVRRCNAAIPGGIQTIGA